MSAPPSKVAKMSSSLDQLKKHTVVVADTGDFEGRQAMLTATSHAHGMPSANVRQATPRAVASVTDVVIYGSIYD